MRVLIITVAIVTVQWVLIHRYPDPKWVLLTLTVPALLWAVAMSGLVAVAGRVFGRRSGGARR